MPRHRNLHAAKVTDVTASWSTTPQTIDEIMYQQLRAVRARSREQSRNNGYIKRYQNLLKNNVIGPNGIKLVPQVKLRNGRPHTKANTAIGKAWMDWCKPKNCSVIGNQSDLIMQQMIMANLPIDGEVFIRKYRGEEYGPYGFQLQLVDPELIDVRHHERLPNGNYLRLGIEYDSMNRPVAYHITDADPSLIFGQYYQGQRTERERVPADNMYHLFVQDAVGQKRGIPWTASVLTKGQMLDGFHESAAINARASASKMWGIETPSPDEYTGADGGPMVEDLSPGQIFAMPEGSAIHSVDARFPDNETESFSKALLRNITSGLNIGYNNAANDAQGVSFSSIRSFELSDRDYYRTTQEWLIDCYRTPLYEDWLSAQVMMGTISISGEPIMPLPIYYNNVSHVGRRWAWVDPDKDSKAVERDLNNLVTSLSQVIREKTGREPRVVLEEIAEDNALLEELGLQRIGTNEPGIETPNGD